MHQLRYVPRRSNSLYLKQKYVGGLIFSGIVRRGFLFKDSMCRIASDKHENFGTKKDPKADLFLTVHYSTRVSPEISGCIVNE